jgi:hypothetical protein
MAQRFSSGRLHRDVRSWHKADIPSCTAHVRFRGQSGHDVKIAVTIFQFYSLANCLKRP